MIPKHSIGLQNTSPDHTWALKPQHKLCCAHSCTLTFVCTSSVSTDLTYTMKINVQVKLVIEEEKKGNSDPIHQTQTAQTCKHEMPRTHGCPALRTGTVGYRSFMVTVNGMFMSTSWLSCTLTVKCFHKLAFLMCNNTLCMHACIYAPNICYTRAL